MTASIFLFLMAAEVLAATPQPAHLLRRIAIPKEFVTPNAGQALFGGDLRIGDLNGDGCVDFVIAKSIANYKPCFIGAFDAEGKAIWSYGDANRKVRDHDSDQEFTTGLGLRPGPVAVYDVEGDGHQEVVALFLPEDATATRNGSLDGVRIIALDGRTGQLKQSVNSPELQACDDRVKSKHEVANFCHLRLRVADLAGRGSARDFVLKAGQTLLAFGPQFELLWTYRNRWNNYPRHSAYIPEVGDLDGDGRDEVIGGHFVLDDNGTPLWEKFLGENMDSVQAAEWDGGHVRAILSGCGQVADASGNILLNLGCETVPHGQEIRCARFREDAPGPQLAIRYNGHNPDLFIAGQGGSILARFKVDSSPNNTGLESVYWKGFDQPALLYSPAALFDGRGEKRFIFPELPAPSGGNQGWFHCFPADVNGDGREEVILYDPLGREVFLYGSRPGGELKQYRHGPRQVNARLMD